MEEEEAQGFGENEINNTNLNLNKNEVKPEMHDKYKFNSYMFNLDRFKVKKKHNMLK